MNAPPTKSETPGGAGVVAEESKTGIESATGDFTPAPVTAQQKNSRAEFIKMIGARVHLCRIKTPTIEGIYVDTSDELSMTRAAGWIDSANMGGFNIYFTPNELAESCRKPKPSAADVVRTRFLSIDIDPQKNHPIGHATAVQEARDKWTEIEDSLSIGHGAAPSFTVSSGNGIQAFWRINPTDDVPETTKLAEHLIRAVGGADSTWNPDRLMRLPFTWNWPSAAKLNKGYDKAPRFAETISVNDRDPHDPQALIAAMRSVTGIGEAKPAAPMVSSHGEIVGYQSLSERFDNACKRSRKLSDRWNGSTSGLSDTSGSGFDMSMVCLLKLHGFNMDEASQLMRTWEFGSVSDRSSDRAYDRRIQRCWTDAPEPKPGSNVLDSKGKPMVPTLVNAASKPSKPLPSLLQAKLAKLTSVRVPRRGEPPVVVRFEKDPATSLPVALMAETISQCVDHSAFNSSSARYLVVDDIGDVRVFAGKALLEIAVDDLFGSLIDKDVVKERCKAAGLDATETLKATNQLVASVRGVAFDYIAIHRQFTEMAISVDMFAKSASISVQEGELSVVFTHQRFQEKRYDASLVADYKEHFGMVDELIGLVVAARFAGSRKKAYVWLHAPSDWGKGLLLSVFQDLGLVVTLSVEELAKIFSGGPVGKTVKDFKRAMVVEFNEVKHISGNVKMLENSISFSPKNQPMVAAQIYTKLFTTAEEISSLASDTSGVEDQFANRFSYIRPEGCIDNRPLFAKDIGAYRDSMVGYFAQKLNTLIDEYVAIGFEAARKRGDDFIIDFHKRNGIDKKYVRLSSKVPQLAEEFQSWVIAIYRKAETSIDLGRSFNVSKDDRAVFDDIDFADGQMRLRSHRKHLAAWLETIMTKSEAGKVNYKAADISAQLTHGKTGGNRYVVISADKKAGVAK